MKTQRIILFLFFLFVGADLVSAAPIVPGSFSTTWEGGDSSVIQINLGVCPSAVYWEEIGNESNNGTSTVCIGSTKTISFPYAGQYRVDFSGNFNQINLIDEFNRGKFRTVEQWGDSEWSHFHQAFLDVPDLTFNAIDAPNLSSLHSMYQMFAGANSFNSPLNHWDVSNVRDMGGMFLNASSFDQPLDNWNVSQVEYANALFSGATAFNQPLNSWDVSDMIYMSEMFAGATAFNQPLNNWNISEPCPLHTGKFWNFFITPAHACIGVFFDMRNMFADSGMDTENYSLTLQGWSRLPVLPQNINLGTVPS